MWGFTEFAPRITPRLFASLGRDRLAAIAGPLFGMAGWGLGWMPLPGDPGLTVGLLGSAFAGFLATVMAGLGNDYGVRPLSGKGGGAS